MKPNLSRNALFAVTFLTLLAGWPAGSARAATAVVTNLADSGSGSLRAALASAANGDTITFSVSGTITLTSGQLTVANSVSVLGPGPAALTVNGNLASRVFNLAGANVTLSGLTIANGQGADCGMGLKTGGTPGSIVALSNCVLTNNNTTLNGGGLFNSSGVTLTISNCTFSGNSAGGSGGGICNSNATLIVIASTLSGNSASLGGGIMNDGQSGSAALALSASTLSGNSADYGGGVYNNGQSGSATVTVNASTFSGNSASGGGSIANSGAWGGSSVKLTVNASTFSGNSALDGGINNDGRFGGSATLELADTILNAGASGVNLYNYSGPITSRGYNLSSDDGGGFLFATGDQTNTNPRLGPLQNNGGLTFTHALAPDSPASDKGKPNAIPALARNTDQRGFARSVDLPTIPNAIGGDGSDIGAFEAQARVWDGSSSGNWSVGANWTGGVPPLDGDILMFPAGAAHLTNTNDLPNLRLNSVAFTGSGYTIRGNPLVVTNGISGQQAAGANTLETPISLGAAQTFDCLSAGASQTLSGNIINGGFTLTLAGSGNITCSGGIGGTGGLIKNGTGTATFAGVTVNTYSGTTYAQAGTLVLNKTANSDFALAGNLVISGTVRLAASEQIVNTADVQVQAAGVLDLASSYEFIDTLRGSGSVTFGTSGYLIVGSNNGTSTFDGVLSGPGFAGGYTLAKEGSGTFTLTGTNTYLNATRVFNGKLIINGYQPQSRILFGPGCMVGGSGTVGTIAAGGTVAPGASPGMLTCSNVSLAYGSPGAFQVELTGPAAGTDYDQLNIRGTVDLAGAALVVSASSTKPVGIGQQFVILNNDAADAITGAFAGLPNNATFLANGFLFRINYNGGSGNDVVLTLLDAPAAAAGYALASGNGDQVIDPNECDALEVTITNQTGIAMSSISATLSSADGNAVVTQPSSTYPNVPPAGTSTNALPFQVSVLPGATCGASLHLNLTLATASHGNFILPLKLRIGVPATPVRFDNTTTTNVPDIGTIESTNIVAAWSGGLLAKLTVSLWLSAPYDADLNLTLIAPDGTEVELSSGNGDGGNFGSGTADPNRTTFDDAAATSILSGTPPFVGAYRPEGSLASLLASSPVGNWRLRIQDFGFWGAPDTLRGWSLFLSGPNCRPGGGACRLCAGGTLLTNTLDTASPTMTTRLFRDGLPSTCAAPKNCPGSYGGNYYYQAYPFYNASSNACVAVTLTSLGIGDLMSGTYLGEFTPGDVCLNYLADCGLSTGETGTRTYSFQVPPNSLFTVVVNHVFNPGSYTLAVSGGDCQPLLTLQPAGSSYVDVSWPTMGGGYQLESSATLAVPLAWQPLTNQPIAAANRFHVTNSVASPGSRFYRLHKP